MAYKLNSLTFQKGQGGSGRQANGTDYISALMFYNDTRPAALLAALPGGVDNFATGSVIQIFSPDDAVALGIDDTHSDETKATASVTVTAIGSNGDTYTLKVAEWVGGTGGGVVTLGTYTKVSGDSTTTLVAVGIVAAINAGTNTHGYTATNAAAVVTITARAKMGAFLNSGTPVTAVIVGTIAATIAQFGAGALVDGVASKLAVYYYHIQRYFAMKPDGTLYIGIFNAAGSGTFSDIDNIANYSKGTVVQMGIWDDTQTFALASLTAIQTRLAALEVAYKYISSVTYAADIKAISTPLTTLAGASYNLATLSAYKVSALIDNDGDGTGYDLFKETGKTISSLGACIGCISEAAISEDMGNIIARFNCDDGVEFDTLMFGDGTFYDTVSKSQLDSLNNNRYVYLSKVAYTSGSWYSDDHTAVAYTSDYAWIHDNRIIDRVIKDEFVALTPLLKSKLKLKTDGTMTDQTIAYIISIAGEVIRALIASEDLAGDPNNFDASKWILVNPTQKPNVNGKLIVAIKLVENAIAHTIEVPIGFASSL